MKWKDVVDIDAWSSINGCISPVHKGAHWHNHHRRRQGCAQVWERFFWGEIWMSWKSGVGWTRLPQARCSGPRMDLPWGLIGACLSGQTIPCWRTRRELQVRGSSFLKPSFSRKASAKTSRNPSCFFDLQKVNIFFGKGSLLTTYGIGCSCNGV